MIIVKISGGLGNQMFQYALISRLQKQYPGVEIKGDVSGYKLYNDHYGLELNRVFGLADKGYLQLAKPVEQFCVRGEMPLLLGGTLGRWLETPQAWLNARTRRLFVKKGKRNVILEDVGIIVEEQLDSMDTGKNWFLDGYWQNEIYFEDMLPELRNQFAFPDFTEEGNRQLAEKIRKTNSVSIHIRRGDYVGTVYDILGMEYYRKAVRYIEERVENPCYFIFSEDRDYIEKQFAWLPDKVIVDENTGMNSFRDMQLMSMCRHNIVANSSFSVWSGFLNAYEGKIVVYPSQYTKNATNTKKLEKGWVEIDA